MRTQTNEDRQDLETWKEASHTELGPRPGPRRAAPNVGRRQGRRAACWLLVASTVPGCALSNYDFDAMTEVADTARVTQLYEGLAAEGESGELYDIGVIPLARTHLTVFAESDDEDAPEGFVETEIDAYLPFFGFVDASVTRYDRDCKRYEHQEWDSFFWGLFQSHREQFDTRAGLREERTLRFLWLFDWRSSPTYRAPGAEVSLE